jgi:hypothetical protein
VKQLNERRDKKNVDFYNEHVYDEYKMLDKEQNTSVAKLAANKTKALHMQRTKSLLSIAEVERDMSKKVAINVNLAQRDPLKFIDSILQHHGSIV